MNKFFYFIVIFSGLINKNLCPFDIELQFTEKEEVTDSIFHLECVKDHNEFINAIRSGDIDTVKYYVNSEKINGAVKDVYGFTPLMYAAQAGKFEIAQFLIPLSNLNERNNLHETAIKIAVNNWHYDIATLIADNGGNIYIKDNKSVSPFDTCPWIFPNQTFKPVPELLEKDVTTRYVPRVKKVGKNFNCPVCDEELSNRKEFRLHLETHKTVPTVKTKIKEKYKNI